MDWRSERITTFRYMRTDRTTRQDIEELDCFEEGGSIEYNDLTAIKVSGSLPYIKLPEIGNDYIRVYSRHIQKGKVHEVLHGTFIASAPSSVLNRKSRKGSLDIYSLLQVIQDASISVPLSIPKNTQAVAFAVTMITGRTGISALGLVVQSDASTAKLSSDWVYDIGTSRLEIINDLLAFAGFKNADVDASGTIRMLAFTNPEELSPTVVLRDDEPGCMFAPSVKHELDFFSVPNVFVAVMSNSEASLVAKAENTDPTSIYSKQSRGREIVVKEDVSDIENQTALDTFARRRLTELSSSVETVEITHPWLSYDMGVGMQLIYTEAAFEMAGVVVKRVLGLTPAMICVASIRRFVRR